LHDCISDAVPVARPFSRRSTVSFAFLLPAVLSEAVEPLLSLLYRGASGHLLLDVGLIRRYLLSI
jgi:hypothetical protein